MVSQNEQLHQDKECIHYRCRNLPYRMLHWQGVATDNIHVILHTWKNQTMNGREVFIIIHGGVLFNTDGIKYLIQLLVLSRENIFNIKVFI